jgi:hypothetical protein
VVGVFHDPGGEAVAEEVAPPLVAAVERLGVGAVEPLEAVREAPELSLDDQMVVVRHQAEGVHAPVVTLDLARQEAEETAVVVGVAEGCGARYASGRDVVRPFVRELSARSPHVATLAPRLAAPRPMRTTRSEFVTLSRRSPWPLGSTTRDSPWWLGRASAGEALD